MTDTRREFVDFQSFEAGRDKLLSDGFIWIFVSDTHSHFRHPQKMDDGFYQRADLYTPWNLNIGRIHFWPASA